MINYKTEISKLEKIIINKKHEARQLRDEISIISDKVREYNRLLSENKNSSVEANEILSGFDRQALSEILLFLVNTFSVYGSGRPKTILNRIDFAKAIKEEEFFNQVIIAVGKPTIHAIFKDIKGVSIDEAGETCLEIKHAGKNNKNLGDRLFSKLTKKSFEDYIIRQGFVI